MNWIELKLYTTKDQCEAMSLILESQGALAVTFQDGRDQPIYEPNLHEMPLWDSTVITGLFEESSKVEHVIGMIQATFPSLRYHLSSLQDQDWQHLWKQDFHPMVFGKRLSVIPNDHPENLTRCQVRMDPGMAFGTGKHPTTALCLTWLDEHILGNEIVLDYGCGSGILGIAALKLGAKEVTAIDHDPQALVAAEENAATNDISPKSFIALSPNQYNPKKPVDLLLANILANPLIQLAEQFANYVSPHGKIVLSGILVEQMEDIKTAYQPWFDIQMIAMEQEWVRIDGVRHHTLNYSR